MPEDAFRFAVYLCPPEADPLYRLGSELLGFDVRAGREVPLPDLLRPEWQRQAAPYGFHLTLVEGFYTDPARLPDIAAELASCCACLSPRADLRLTGGRVEVWDAGEVIVWRLDPSPDLRAFQTLLAARLAPFATHSPFDDEARAHPERYAEPFQQARLRLLGTPRVLEGWQPHFTLVQPFPEGEARARALAARLSPLLASHRERRLAAVSLFEKGAHQAHWRVVQDLALPTFQSAAG